MKKTGNLFTIGICMIMLIIGFSSIHVYAQPEQFQIEIECGFGGVIKETLEVPVTLTIHNQGDSFAGRVCMSLEESYNYRSPATVHEATIVIGAGETKSVRFYLPQGASMYDVAVWIQTESGNTVFRKEEAVYVSHNANIVGVLSDDYSALNYLAELKWLDYSFSLSKPTTVNLAKNLNLLDYRGIQLLDAIVINDFQTGQLTQSQANLIKGWVAQGGTLLVGTGVNHQKTVSGFIDDYIGGTIGMIASNTGYLGVRDEYNIPEESVLALDILDIRIDNAVSPPDGWHQIVRKGKGNIAVFAFDLASKGLLDWSYRNQSMEQMINNILYDKTGRASFHQLDSYNISSSISNVYINTIPSISHYIIVLAVYIILLPILFLFLRKKDKQHYIWGAIPALSVLFAIVIYITGGGSRLKNPNLNYLCVLTMNDDAAQETVFMGATSPRNSPYQFSVSADYSVSPVSNYYSYYGNRTMVTIGQEASSHIVGISSGSSFDTAYFVSERYNDSVGDIAVTMNYRQDGYHFSVTNRSAFVIEDAGIVVPFSGVVPIARLEPGQTASYDEIIAFFGDYSDAANIILPYNSAPEEQVASRRNQLTAFMQNNSDSIYFIGFAGGYAPDVGYDARIDTAGNTIVFQVIDQMEDDQKSYIPNIARYAFDEGLDFTLVDHEYDAEYTYYSYRFGDVSVESLSLLNLDYSDYISFYNYESQIYDHVFLGGGYLSDLSAYLSDDHVLRVRNEMSYYYMDSELVISAVVVP